MSERVYEIQSQTKYSITITEIDNIEDCGDHFITQEELTEMGIRYNYGTAPRLFDNKIKAEINRLISKIAEGKKSIIIDDDELVEVLTSSSRAVSEFVKGTRRVGNRLSLYTKKVVPQTKVKYKNWTTLVLAYERILKEKFEVYVDVKRNDSDRKGFVEVFKKGFTWEDVLEIDVVDKDDIEWCKKLWDNPELIDKSS